MPYLSHFLDQLLWTVIGAVLVAFGWPWNLVGALGLFAASELARWTLGAIKARLPARRSAPGPSRGTG